MFNKLYINYCLVFNDSHVFSSAIIGLIINKDVCAMSNNRYQYEIAVTDTKIT